MGLLGKGGWGLCVGGLGKGVEFFVDSRMCCVDWVKGLGFWVDSTFCLKD